MKFENKSDEPIKVRLVERQSRGTEFYRWLTVKPGDVVDVPQEIGFKKKLTPVPQTAEEKKEEKKAEKDKKKAEKDAKKAEAKDEVKKAEEALKEAKKKASDANKKEKEADEVEEETEEEEDGDAEDPVGDGEDDANESDFDFKKDLLSIDGVGKATAEDILKVYPKKEDLVKAFADNAELPFRDDVVELLRGKYA